MSDEIQDVSDTFDFGYVVMRIPWVFTQFCC